MKRKVKIIGVPMDLGAGRRGVDMGPSAIRIAGLNQSISRFGFQVEDAGNVHVRTPESIKRTNIRAHYLPEITSVCEQLRIPWKKPSQKGAIPVILGGDHSIAIGSAAGVASHYQETKQAHRNHLVGCSYRHQYAGKFTFRKRSRNAARGIVGTRPKRIDAYRRVLAKSPS